MVVGIAVKGGICEHHCRVAVAIEGPVIRIVDTVDKGRAIKPGYRQVSALLKTGLYQDAQRQERRLPTRAIKLPAFGYNLFIKGKG